jgi:hypothetical protein
VFKVPCAARPSFESTYDDPLSAATAGRSKAPIIGGCGFNDVLLHATGAEAPTLLALTASREQQCQRQQGCITLTAETSTISGWEQISGHIQLMHICQQPGTICDDRGLSLSYLQMHCQPCWLLLCKRGSTLQLLAAHNSKQQRVQQQQKQQLSVSLLAEFEHDCFEQLEQPQCWLAPGPRLLLQPEPEQLLLIAPAAAAADAAHGANASSSAGCADEWQLLELDLSAEQLLSCLHQEQLASMVSTEAAGNLPLQADFTSICQRHAFNGNSRDGLLHAAAGPLKVLHFGQATQDSSSAQLLVSLPVAETTHRGTVDSRKQALLLWLEVQLSSSEPMGPAPTAAAAAAAASAGVAADAADGQEAYVHVPGLRVLCCYATGWQDTPACAAVHAATTSSVYAFGAADATAWRQSIAVGSSSGDVQLLQVSSRLLAAQQRHQQGFWVAQELSNSSSCFCMLQAQAKLVGPVESITQLAQVYVAGAVQHNVLAVLHGAGEPGSSSSSSVSLLVQQAGQLQVVAAVQGAAALMAPSCSPAGLLCPWQQQQQQSSSNTTVLDSNALQLAALVVLDQQHLVAAELGEQDGKQASLSSALDCYARLPSGSAAGQLPGAVVGLLQCLPPGQQIAAAAGTNNEKLAATSSLNELRGLQAMHAALEARWQQGGHWHQDWTQSMHQPWPLH